MFCVALLIALAILPIFRGVAYPTNPVTALLLVLVYGALAALAAYLFVVIRRIESTQQTEMESAQELYELSERLNTTLRSIGDGVISTDVDGVVTLMNDVAVQLTGWPQAKAIGMRAAELFQLIHERTRQPEENPAKLVLALRQAHPRGRPRHPRRRATAPSTRSPTTRRRSSTPTAG